jgi:hypothetical protein
MLHALRRLTENKRMNNEKDRTRSVETTIPQEHRQLSIEEQRNAMKYLTETRDTLEMHVSNLTDAQWNFKPSPQKWSILDVLEHLVVFEGYSHYVIGSMKDLASAKSDHDSREIEQFILGAVPDRSKTLQSPEPGHPTGRWASTEIVEQFLLARARTLELVKESSYLRGRIVHNPLYSPSDWDGYCWVLATALHTGRHTLQIEDIKNDIRFSQAS